MSRERRAAFALGACLVAIASAGCRKDEPPAPPRTSVMDGTDGGGDRTGSSIANARALTKGSTASFSIGCKATVYTGPFRFSKDPEKLTIAGTAKSPTGVQLCIGGDWVDASGKTLGPSGLGCVEQKAVAEGKPDFEYSPGNGGQGANPVFLALRVAEPKPEGCPSAEITLSLP